MTAAASLRLATRGSALARAQADLAVSALRAAGAAAAQLVVVRSEGDRRPDVPAAAMTGQGWFTAALERAVLEGRADAAVHSAKDLPGQPTEGLAVVAHLVRADARDALVSRGGVTLESLPQGASVATSSPRREAFLAALRPDLRCLPIRGNVDSRLRRLDEGEVDALLVAAAGLDRLGLGARAAQRLDPREFVPAPAQGAVALQAPLDSPAARACAGADDPGTTAAVTAERAVLTALGGGCRLPLGAWARWEDGALVVVAALAGPDGVRRAEVGGDASRAHRLGLEAAARLAGR